MKTDSRVRRQAPAALLCLLLPFVLAAAPKPLTPADALKWKLVQAPTISPDGRWLAFQFGSADGDKELVVRAVKGEKEYRFAVGQGTQPADFSADSAWLAFATFPTRKTAEQNKKAKKPFEKGAALVNLADGRRLDYPRIRNFVFSRDSAAAIALHRYGASGGGSELILRNLSSGEELTFGGVAQFSFDKRGRWLAWTVTTDDQVGNNVSLRNLTTGVVTTLDSGKAQYDRLSWSEDGKSLVVLKGVENKVYAERWYSILGVTDIDRHPLRVVEFNPAGDKTFPAGMRIAQWGAPPRWSEDRQALLFGIAEWRKKEEGGTDAASAAAPETPDVMIWHWRDSRLQIQQQMQEKQDMNTSYLATWRVAEKKFIRLADETLPDVDAPRRGRFAVGRQSEPYELTFSLEGRRYNDVYAVDLHTGARQLVGRKMPWLPDQSPDGNSILYFLDGQYHVFDVRTGRSTNITGTLPVSFVNVEIDQNMPGMPVQPMGWTSDSRNVLLQDLWDVWLVSVDGAKAVNLTGNGRVDGIHYMPMQIYPEARGFDLSRPLYFIMLGEWTKKAGYSRREPGRHDLQVLLWDDAKYMPPTRARKAGTLFYTRSTPTVFPDLYVADEKFQNARRLSDGQAQLADYQWSAGARLVDYQSDSQHPELKGRRLQASLLLPAGYEPGRSYPTIVSIYEHQSDNMNAFLQPRVIGFDPALYTSNGYAVLLPDISYVLNDPGMSALSCVLPALKAAVATGVVDPARVGLHGHSWGGYQTAFLVTQTNVFKAAVAGAAPTDMVSMYGLLYRRAGVGNMVMFESGQARFTGAYWNHWDAYMRNSPIMHARDVSTPLIIMQNDQDPYVDFTQGVEYYNALRRMGKPVVMLQYVGEKHFPDKPASQYDYTVRMREFYDHYLKGAPAPGWWTDGVPRLELKEHLKARLPPE